LKYCIREDFFIINFNSNKSVALSGEVAQVAKKSWEILNSNLDLSLPKVFFPVTIAKIYTT